MDGYDRPKRHRYSYHVSSPLAMNQTLRPLLFGGDGGASPIADAGLLVLRVIAGLSLAFAHGLGKIPPSPGFIAGTGAMGFPFPELFAWMAGLAEFGGGLLIVIGLLTRPASLFVAITMVVAAFIKNGGEPYAQQEKAVLFLVIALALMVMGSGRFGLDRLIYQKRDDRIWR